LLTQFAGSNVHILSSDSHFVERKPKLSKCYTYTTFKYDYFDVILLKILESLGGRVVRIDEFLVLVNGRVFHSIAYTRMDPEALRLSSS